MPIDCAQRRRPHGPATPHQWEFDENWLKIISNKSSTNIYQQISWSPLIRHELLLMVPKSCTSWYVYSLSTIYTVLAPSQVLRQISSIKSAKFLWFHAIHPYGHRLPWPRMIHVMLRNCMSCINQQHLDWWEPMGKLQRGADMIYWRKWIYFGNVLAHIRYILMGGIFWQCDKWYLFIFFYTPYCQLFLFDDLPMRPSQWFPGPTLSPRASGSAGTGWTHKQHNAKILGWNKWR